MQKKSAKIDYSLIIITTLLVIFGLVMLSSASVVMSTGKLGDSYYYLKHQFFIGIIGGGAAAFLISKIDYNRLRKAAFPLLIISLALLAVVFIPGAGKFFGGAKRWISIGSFTFQPSELAKLIFVVYLSAWMSADDEKVKNLKKGFIPFFALMTVLSALLIKQPDVGTLGLIVIVSLIIFFAAGAKLSYLFSFLAAGAAALWVLIKTAPYRMNRFLVFMNPKLDPKGIGYQINQALLAIGSGGIFGLGLGYSRQKYSYLPEPIGDSIFAIIAEELGLIGAAAIIILFVLFAWRGFKIAKNAPDKFGKLLAIGITSWIIVQAIINIAAITSLMPLTGITLPFISYGSSSLVMALMGVGVLINISKV